MPTSKGLIDSATFRNFIDLPYTTADTTADSRKLIVKRQNNPLTNDFAGTLVLKIVATIFGTNEKVEIEFNFHLHQNGKKAFLEADSWSKPDFDRHK